MNIGDDGTNDDVALQVKNIILISDFDQLNVRFAKRRVPWTVVTLAS